ncbi:MAG: septum formation initiator family protein [Bradymonadaceae bacterium]
MRRIALTLLIVGALSALAYYVFTHPARKRVQRLRERYRTIREKNRRLAESNEELRREIHALREDPRAVERRARHRNGLVRPGEIVFTFPEDGEGERVHVDVHVREKAVEVGGERVSLDEFGSELTRLHDRLPDAEIDVHFGDATGALRRERARQALRESPFERIRYPDGSGEADG